MAAKPVKAKSGKGRWVIIATVILVTFGGAAGSTWWFLIRPKPQLTPQQLTAQHEMLAHFISLDPFVTNVLSQDGSPHYLQVKIDLKTYEPKADEEVKTMTPEIRNTILRILAAQQADKVSTVQVREQLRQEILVAINRILTSGSGVPAHAPAIAHVAPPASPITGVYFTAFVVQ